MLVDRKATILRAIVADYVETAMPVASATIAQRYALGVSPATIRNTMADLEEEGYITHPHTSAGRVPSDKGYRYYVETLMGEADLSAEESRSIYQKLHQGAWDIEVWIPLAASLLAQSVRNLSVLTTPKSSLAKIKHIELVSLQELLVLLVLVLQEPRVKKQTIALDSPLSQDELTAIANKLNTACAGLTYEQVGSKLNQYSPVEKQIIDASLQLMRAEDERSFEDLYFDGLRHIARQPEFSNSTKMRQIIEILEERRALGYILSKVLSGDGVVLVIGSENEQDALRECSIVFTKYGIPGELSGVLGVLGPTRMQYARTISFVRYLSTLMGELLGSIRS